MTWNNIYVKYHIAIYKIIYVKIIWRIAHSNNQKEIYQNISSG